MKGYFARIATRATGTLPKATLAPSKASLWHGAGETGMPGLQAANRLGLDQWDGNLGGETSGPMRQHNALQNREQQVLSGLEQTTHAPGQMELTPPAVQRHVTPPSIELQPASNPLQAMEAILGPHAKPVTPPAESPDAKDNSPVEILHPTALPISPAPSPITPSLPSQRVMRAVNTTEGLYEGTPSIAPMRPATEKPQVDERQITAKPQRESQPSEQNRRELNPAPAAQETSTRMSPMPKVSPQQHPNTSPMQQRLQSAKNQLVIGKITVEVSNPQQPSVVTQHVAAPVPQRHPARTPSFRPENTLKFGLGQL